MIDSNVHISANKTTIYFLEEFSSSCRSRDELGTELWWDQWTFWSSFASVRILPCNTGHYWGHFLTPYEQLLGELVKDTTPASFRAVAFTPFPLYDCLGDVLADDPIIIIISRQRFVWQLFDLCVLLLYTAVTFLVACCFQFCQRPGVLCQLLERFDLVPYTVCPHTFPNELPLSYNKAPVEDLLIKNLWTSQRFEPTLNHKFARRHDQLSDNRKQSCCPFLEGRHLWRTYLRDELSPDNMWSVLLLRRWNGTIWLSKQTCLNA